MSGGISATVGVERAMRAFLERAGSTGIREALEISMSGGAVKGIEALRTALSGLFGAMKVDAARSLNAELLKIAATGRALQLGDMRIDLSAQAAALMQQGSEAGTMYGAALAAGIAAQAGSAASAAASVRSAAVSAMASGAGSARSIGASFSAGLASGIRAGQSGVISAAISVARAAATAARAALAIHSPSRVTERMGQAFDQGFVRGVAGEQPEIDRAVREAVYIQPPQAAQAMSAARSAGDVTVNIDYEALADAMEHRQQVLALDGRAVARLNSEHTAQAQNARARDLALRYGMV